MELRECSAKRRCGRGTYAPVLVDVEASVEVGNLCSKKLISRFVEEENVLGLAVAARDPISDEVWGGAESSWVPVNDANRMHVLRKMHQRL